MKAILLSPGTSNVWLGERPEPALESPHQVKLRVIEVGICGTDREEAAGGRADAPAGSSDLVLGHEMLGQVVEAGAAVTSLAAGDYAVLTVRWGCDSCPACLASRSDLCFSGNYTERGIKGRDGYQTEFVVDDESHAIKVPPELVPFAVLTEPMSIAEKAITEALQVQRARLPAEIAGEDWFNGRHVLVAGLGPVGLLAAIALVNRGARVFGLDVVDEGSPRAGILKLLGGTYVDGRASMPAAIAQHYGAIDVIFEATGIAHLEFDLLGALGPNGVYLITGIPSGDRPIEIDGGALIRGLVLDNQVMVGSVNASRANFEAAVDDLARAHQRWPEAVGRLVTHRLPVDAFASALSQHPPDEIKTVIRWAE